MTFHSEQRMKTRLEKGTERYKRAPFEEQKLHKVTPRQGVHKARSFIHIKGEKE